MAAKHNVSFFGQKSAMIFDSDDQTKPHIWMRFLKNNDGKWEKPSNNEGKSVKFGITEMIAIIDVASKNDSSWKTVHQMKENKTSIMVENKDNTITFKVGDYVKPLKYPETTYFKRLMMHILDEKIAFATVNDKPQQKDETPVNESSNEDASSDNDYEL